jgi:predicted ester cyclase
MKTKAILLFAGLLCALMVTSCATDPKESKEYKDLKAELDKIKGQDSLEVANIEIYKRFVAVNDTLKLGDLDAFVAADLNFHDMPEGMPNGLAGFKELMKGYFISIPNMEVEIKHIMSEGDLVLAHTGLKGTNTGESMGMPATGKSIAVDAYDCIRIADGKIVEYWSVVDAMKMMMQMGLMPEMEGHEEAGKGK